MADKSLSQNEQLRVRVSIMRKLLAQLMALWIVALLHTTPAEATITLSLVPSSTSVTTGSLVSVSAFISGLGRPPAVGAFDLEVGFNPSLVSPITVAFGPYLGDPSSFEALTAFDFSIPGVAEFAEVSLLSPSDLNILQPASFLLGTLSFIAISNGTVGFGFTSVRVDDAFGNKLAIPEPGTILLLGLCLLALRGFASRSKSP